MSKQAFSAAMMIFKFIPSLAIFKPEQTSQLLWYKKNEFAMKMLHFVCVLEETNLKGGKRKKKYNQTDLLFFFS